jgi:hypothetical protein
MATTTNYGWTTPNDTDLVKDGAAAIRTLGSSIDTSFAADEGDLLVGGTSNIFEALPIGALGTVLTSDGDTAEWAAPPAAGANWSLLNAGGTALTGAQTVTVSGISGKDKIAVIVDRASSASANSQISVRLNTQTGSIYYEYGFQFYFTSSYNSGNLDAVFGAATRITLGQMSAGATSQVTGGVTITGCNASGVKQFIASGTGSPSSSNGQGAFVSQGYVDLSATITSVSVFSSTGNLDNGTVFVYTSA